MINQSDSGIWIQDSPESTYHIFISRSPLGTHLVIGYTSGNNTDPGIIIEHGKAYLQTGGKLKDVDEEVLKHAFHLFLTHIKENNA